MAEWTKARARERERNVEEERCERGKIRRGVLCEMGMKCEVIVFRYQLSVGA